MNTYVLILKVEAEGGLTEGQLLGANVTAYEDGKFLGQVVKVVDVVNVSPRTNSMVVAGNVVQRSQP